MVISTHFVRNQHGHKTKKSFKDQEKYITQCDQMNVIKRKSDFISCFQNHQIAQFQVKTLGPLQILKFE